MKLSLAWLREYVDIDLSPAELASRLTDATAEVEGYEMIGGDWDRERILVAEVLRLDPHPNADRLRLATVDAGQGEQTVVCGAPNVAAGQKVAFATEGARLVDGHSGKEATLKLRPIRGVESAGMVLSEKELGLSDDHEGILVLPATSAVGTPLADAIGDVVFDLDTWANRADLLGLYSFAREIAAFTGKPLREIDLSYPESDRAAADLIDVSIQDPDLCRRFTASVIEGVKVAPSPPWLQERLRRLGQRSINNVVDITNYVMLETGQPLHAFDYEKIRGRAIIARRARPAERLTTLDDIDRELDPDMLLICDAEGPLGIAGIMGGGESEVSESTTTVLLEVANFHPASIRKTSQKLKLRTEASSRFEKGIGVESPLQAQGRALNLFAAVTGGSVARGLVDAFPDPSLGEPKPVTLTPDRIEQVLGMAIPAGDVTRILEALGFELSPAPGGSWSVVPPWWRTDVEIADDLIEEVGRIYGYDRLPATMLRGELPPDPPEPLAELRETLRDRFAAAGFQEVITYTLTTTEALESAVPEPDTRRRTPLGVVNPVASQHTWLRTSLRPSLLSTWAANRRRHEGAIRIFEIGFEYLPREEALPHERPVLCALIGGQREERWPGSADAEPLDFYDAKGSLESVLESLGVAASCTPDGQHGLLAGHTARIDAGKRNLGVVAQVHPDLAATFDIDEPVFLVELAIEDLVAVVPGRPDYRPISRFPELRQDIAVVVPESVAAGEVLARVRQARLVASAGVFDLYRGPGIPGGHKSLAIRIHYQAPDRTLTDADVAKIQQGLLQRLERELGATLRGA